MTLNKKQRDDLNKYYDALSAPATACACFLYLATGFKFTAFLVFFAVTTVGVWLFFEDL